MDFQNEPGVRSFIGVNFQKLGGTRRGNRARIFGGFREAIYGYLILLFLVAEIISAC
jgi:hypothetical protein